MLDPNLIPTQLVKLEERQKIIIVDPSPPSDHWVLHFLRILSRYGVRALWAFLRRRLTPAENAHLVRLMLEELSGLWIKAGQLLSLRVDLFSEEFCAELSKLQYRAEGFPTPMARAAIEEDLGVPIDAVFDHFQDEPFATASIGQIYRAHLKHEDVWVAIKVQRPYIAVQFVRDMQLIGWIVRMLQISGRLRFMRWDEGLWELNQVMHEELDYRYEASSVRRMKKSLRPHNIYVPSVFRRYTSKRVLVTEFIHAGLMSDFISLYRTDPARLSLWLQENNIDPKLVAHRLILSVFRQLFEDNLYHGDLHPGNIILLKDSRVAFIDMGSIGFTEMELLERFRILAQATAQRDFSKAADMAFLLISSLPEIDLDAVKSRLVRILRAWAARTFVRELPYHEKSLDNFFVEMTRLMFDYQITVEWAFLRIRRVLTTLDSALIYLYPDVNYIRLMEDYFEASQRRKIVRSLRETPARTLTSISELFELQKHANEYLFHQSAIIRRQAQVFEGTTSKFAYFFQILFGQLAGIEIAVGIAFLITFLHQHYHWLVQPWMGQQIERMTQVFPAIDYQVWILLLVVDAYICTLALRLRNRFAKRETRGTNVSN